MSRVSNSYESVVRGVSEQVPQDRRPGQHYEQINLISDPVRGLARRHGSINMHEKRLRAYTEAGLAGILDDTQGHKVYSFQCNGQDYDLIYRTRGSPTRNDADYMFCYNKDTAKFIPVVSSAGGNCDHLKVNGVSALVNVGKYLFIAGNAIVPALSSFDAFASTKSKLVAWVRGGAYSRTYRIRLVRASGAVNIVTYTTPPSSYPNTLSTADIPASDPEYTKKVNDRVNGYNTAVTQWIGTAAAAIVPAAIAAQLAYAITSSMTGTNIGVDQVDSTVVIDTTTMPDPVVDIITEDGGDGTLFRGVGSVVSSAELVSTVHHVGKIVQVRPKKNDGSDVYYLKAYAKVAGTSSFTEVMWREAAGYESTPTDLYAIATVVDEVLYIGNNATALTALCGGTHPAPVANGVGDRTSVPVPAFFGKRIDFMAMFQDRLVIGSGAVLFFSRTGDYQNFWRQSVLGIDDADPIELFALGAEDDTIKAATTYDRNLLIFGRRKQYVVSGRQPITPRNASIVVQSSHEDAVDSFPINSGNFVFYNKYRNGNASAHQVQIGQLVDTPESYEISKQLDRYIKGKPAELTAVTSPNVVFLRTETQRDRLYVYTYLDSAAGTERLFDSWSTWKWNTGVGSICGLSRHEGDILAYYIRRGKGASDDTEQLYIACDKFVLDTGLSEYPYVDSLRSASTMDAGGENSMSAGSTGSADLSIAFGDGTDNYLLGGPLSTRAEFDTAYPGAENKWVGWNYDALVTPTNPYILDRNNKAIINGRLTITSFNVSVADTGGLTAKIDTANGSTVPTDFTGRLIGRASNLVGRQPIVTTAVSVSVGREVRDFKYTLCARKWLPLTITALEWKGQFFNNVRRM